MPHGDDVALPHEQMRLAELELLDLRVDLDGVQHHEERAVVLLELGSLVGAMGILDGEIVQGELALDDAQELFARLEQPDPDELLGLLEDLADVLERDLTHAAAVGVGCARDDSAHGHALRRPRLPARPDDARAKPLRAGPFRRGKAAARLVRWRPRPHARRR